MSPTDALFWALDAVPELRSTMGALLVLERAPDPDRLRADFARITRGMPRMRQRVVETPLGLAPPEWGEDPDFDLDYHLRTIAVPAPATMNDLLAELGPLYATPLDRDRPLWEAYYTSDLVDGRAAVFLKMHHCLIDGVGGTQVLTDLFAERAGKVPPRRRDDRAMTPGPRLVRALAHNVAETVALGSAAVRALLESGRHPMDAIGGLAAGTRRALGFASELGMSRADSPLHHHRGLSRRLATFDIHLGEIDAVRRRLGATNNDVVLTLVSGALHRWHTSRGADVKALRVLLPVNLRQASDDAGGNRIALLAIDLPVGEPNPLARLRAIQENVGRVKTDQRATLYPLVTRAIAGLPSPILAAIGRQQMGRTNLVVTNVPGPRQTCFLAGEAIERLYAYAPLVGDHPIAIALYSYRDMVHVGLDVDPVAMPDADHFRDALAESYAEVVGLAQPDTIAVSGVAVRGR